MLDRRSAIAVFAAAFVAAAAAPAAAQPVSISTLPPGAINNVQAQVVAKVVQENAKLQMRVVSFNSPAAIIGAVQNKQAEFAWTSNDEYGAAFRGDGDYKGKAMKNVVLAATMIPFHVGIMVKKDSPIKKVEDLKGQLFPTGWSGFTQGIPLCNAMLATANMSLDDVKPFPSLNLIRAADDMKAGKVVGTQFAVGAPKVAEVDSALGGVRFLSLDDSPEALARMQKVRPEYHIAKVNPAPHLPGVIGPTNLMRYYIILVVNKDTPDDVVYRTVKAIHGGKAALAAGHPSFMANDPAALATPQKGMTYHPGAMKFYREIGLVK